jgi:phosphomevalonate kinase
MALRQREENFHGTRSGDGVHRTYSRVLEIRNRMTKVDPVDEVVSAVNSIRDAVRSAKAAQKDEHVCDGG